MLKDKLVFIAADGLIALAEALEINSSIKSLNLA
jgi:hypothetical protein